MIEIYIEWKNKEIIHHSERNKNKNSTKSVKIKIQERLKEREIYSFAITIHVKWDNTIRDCDISKHPTHSDKRDFFIFHLEGVLRVIVLYYQGSAHPQPIPLDQLFSYYKQGLAQLAQPKPVDPNFTFSRKKFSRKKNRGPAIFFSFFFFFFLFSFSLS